ncbi:MULTISPECIES: hypothetical protein [unclassified Nostoc]|nr:hypothetical protein [Nostoc sp. ChiQUE02]MDZ8229680.1 hypothetical protein [Nostoc sp. ChiQUE02]
MEKSPNIDNRPLEIRVRLISIPNPKGEFSPAYYPVDLGNTNTAI